MMTNPLVLVETFIKRLHDGDIIVLPEAASVTYYVQKGLTPIPLPDVLANSISVYEAHKLDLEHLLQYAEECLGWINRVIARGLIKEGSGVFSKLRVYEEEYGRLALENKQLKEEKDKLLKEVERVKKLNERLHETLDRFGRAGNVSDVSGDEHG